MSDNTYNIKIEYPEKPSDTDLTATVTYPDDTTQTLTTHEFNEDDLFKTLPKIIDADNHNDPQHNFICNNPDKRAEFVLECLHAYPGCYDATYNEYEQSITAFFSTTSTEDVEELEYFFNLISQATEIGFTRDFGVHLRVHWKVADYAYNIFEHPNFERDDFIDRYADKTPLRPQTIESILTQHDEHESITPPVVTDESVADFPRITGTETQALHLVWLLRERDTDRDELSSHGYDTLTSEDIDHAIEYANNHPDEYENYKQHKQHKQDFIFELK